MALLVSHGEQVERGGFWSGGWEAIFLVKELHPHVEVRVIVDEFFDYLSVSFVHH